MFCFYTAHSARQKGQQQGTLRIDQLEWSRSIEGALWLVDTVHEGYLTWNYEAGEDDRDVDNEVGESLDLS